MVVLGFVTLAACGESATTSPATTAPTTAPATTAPATTATPSTSAPATSTTVTRAPVDPAAPVAELAAGLNDAGFDLLRTQAVDENVVFSPASIGHALLMAEAAADEQTAAAIETAFALPEDAHEAWNALDQQLSAAADDNDQVDLAVADRIWPGVDAAPDPAWITLLGAQHGAAVERLDLRGDPVASRQRINGWVDEQTKGLIPELLPEGFISPNTVLVLTDAVYFAADWKRPFGKSDPVDGVFTRLDGTTVDVSFMKDLELDDRRGAGEGFVGAEVPYAGDQFSMLLVVPDEGRFEEVRDRLSQGLLAEIDQSFTTGPYELQMPKWEDTTQLDLLPWLTELGAAPGSYPAISPEAFLGGAVHGADIAVDEQGTVAAAATALGFEESGPPDPELVVAADHPFLYLIRHRPTGLVLFAGQVTDPTS